jgi:hypothetical protein
LRRLCGEEVELACDIPVPGILKDWLAFPWPKVVFNPRLPTVTLDPLLPIFHRTPGRIFTERRKRQDILFSSRLETHHIQYSYYEDQNQVVLESNTEAGKSAIMKIGVEGLSM